MTSILIRVLGLAITLAALISPQASAKDVRIASHVSETSPLYTNAQLFSDRITPQLADAFTFKFFPNGQLGKETALIDNLKLGSLEMAMVASGVLKLDDRLGLFDLPWLFSDRANVREVLSGPLGKAVQDLIEKEHGLIVLGIYENGFRHVINTKRAIEKPEDLNGLKIRVTGSKFKRDGFSAMGADPVPIEWQETFGALQQGVVDGAEAALYGFYSSKLFEIAGYLSLTNHTYSPSFLLASKTFWDSLTDEQKKIFRKTAEDITDEAYQQAAELEEGFLTQMKGALKVNEVVFKDFQEKSESIYTSYTQQYGQDWLNLVRQSK